MLTRKLRKTFSPMAPFQRSELRGHDEVTDADDQRLTLEASQLVLIDHQPDMAMAVRSLPPHTLMSNVIALAAAANALGVRTTMTVTSSEGGSARVYPGLMAVVSDPGLLEYRSGNAWEDLAVRSALAENARRKLVVSGLWTEAGIDAFVRAAMRGANYQTFVVSDACGGRSVEAHEHAIRLLVEAGAISVTWHQAMLAWQGASENLAEVAKEAPTRSPSRVAKVVGAGSEVE